MKHREAVVGCAVFNKARRKAFINGVMAFDDHGEKVNVAWGAEIDHLGNPVDPRGLIGVVDSSSLYVRRKDGEAIHYLKLEIRHSFRDSPCTEIVDPTADWGLGTGGQS